MLVINGTVDENQIPIDIVGAKRAAVFQGVQKPKMITSICFLNDETLLTAGSDGMVINWGNKLHDHIIKGRSPTPVFLFKAHHGPIFSLQKVNGYWQDAENSFFSGGKDGVVNVWNLGNVMDNQNKFSKN